MCECGTICNEKLANHRLWVESSLLYKKKATSRRGIEAAKSSLNRPIFGVFLPNEPLTVKWWGKLFSSLTEQDLGLEAWKYI